VDSLRPSNRIQVFRKDGTYVSESILAPQTYGPGSNWDQTLGPVYSWGTGGRQPGQFDWVHNMDFDSQGNLFTGEVQTGHRVQKFIRLNGR